MIVKTSLFNSVTDDTAIAIDLLRASTTITVALGNFNKVIPVDNNRDAFSIREEFDDVVLAGEHNLETIEGYDINNSPSVIRQCHGNILVINTTNGTRVLNNIKKRNNDVNVLVGASINAQALAVKALDIACDEVELVMAGRHEHFNIEDCVGAGLIINEMVVEAEKRGIELEVEESSFAAGILAENKSNATSRIENSKAACRLKCLGLIRDVKICSQINKVNIAPVYNNGVITKD